FRIPTTTSSDLYDTALRAALPVSKKIALAAFSTCVITSLRISGQPWFVFEYTSGHRSTSSAKPSLSLSGTGHPSCSGVPATYGHLSLLSGIPSPSVSGQPLNWARPATSGQESVLSGIPSPSLSGQPLNWAVPGISGHWSSESSIPSLSRSLTC